jgi:hypothetical protein
MRIALDQDEARAGNSQGKTPGIDDPCRMRIGENLCPVGTLVKLGKLILAKDLIQL